MDEQIHGLNIPHSFVYSLNGATIQLTRVWNQDEISKELERDMRIIGIVHDRKDGEMIVNCLNEDNEKIQSLQAEVERLREYAKHKDHCGAVRWADPWQDKAMRRCDCGLSELTKGDTQ